LINKTLFSHHEVLSLFLSAGQIHERCSPTFKERDP
jgi:hypothetical protein